MIWVIREILEFPIQIRNSSKLNLQAGFGAVEHLNQEVK
jgi:hypothetical protein